MSDLVCVEQSGMMFWTHFSNIMAVTGFILSGCLLVIVISVYRFLRVPSKKFN
jgi:hypothetical protein